jgi:probable rRNA maturation factor
VTPTLHVEVVKAVRAPLAPAFLRSVLERAAPEPAVAARLASAATLGQSRGGCGLTLRVTGDRELRRLNRQFLGEDHATDVLSFPAGGWPPAGGYLGDLALSWPAVERQAVAFGHPAEVEAALLAVHGFLHLLGWDHADEPSRREMTAVTLACLGRSALSPSPARL